MANSVTTDTVTKVGLNLEALQDLGGPGGERGDWGDVGGLGGVEEACVWGGHVREGLWTRECGRMRVEVEEFGHAWVEHCFHILFVHTSLYIPYIFLRPSD